MLNFIWVSIGRKAGSTFCCNSTRIWSDSSDIHPQRHALAHRERQIYIFKEAIRLKSQLQAAEAGIPASTDPPDSTRALEGAAQDTVPPDVAPECASPSALPTSKRRHGPKPDMDSHLKVAAIAADLNNWKDDLETLCNRLDQAGYEYQSLGGKGI
jgi:hypothetical protein